MSESVRLKLLRSRSIKPIKSETESSIYMKLILNESDPLLINLIRLIKSIVKTAKVSIKSNMYTMYDDAINNKLKTIAINTSEILKI